MYERTNLRMELTVAAGIALSIHGGIDAAARFMAHRGVPHNVAERVLLHPDQRRKSDNCE